MDFTRPLVQEESIASKSGLRLVQIPNNEDDETKSSPPAKEDEELDLMVSVAANEAAKSLLFANISPEHLSNEKITNSKFFYEHMTPLKETIHEGDLVVIMESFDNLNFVYAKKGEQFMNRNGHFPHELFIGKPFGSKIRSSNNRGYGFVHVMKPTVELWAQSLNHRTQIVQELDQSMIVFQLGLRPNMTVVESGTGSGAMSHAILRTIAPHGHLHTYEFNRMRADTARKEFAKNGASHLVTVYHRDVCAKGKNEGGFELPENSVDGVFLDLPEPWTAVPSAAFILKPNARICTYSPCVEQTQRTVEMLENAGFHSIKTMEYRQQEHYVDEVSLERPPRTKRPKYESADHIAIAAKLNAAGSGKEAATDNDARNDTNAEPANEGDDQPVTEDDDAAQDEKKMLVARPFSMMKGHTAYLTFATLGR